MSEEYEVPNFLKDISKADTQNMVQTHLDVESTRSSVYHKFKEKATKEGEPWFTVIEIVKIYTSLEISIFILIV